MKPFDQWPALKTLAIAFIASLYCINLTSAHVIDHLISDTFIGHFSNEIYLACKTSSAASAILLVTCIFCLAFIIAKNLKPKKGIVSLSSILFAIALWVAVDDFWLYPSVSGWPGDFKWWLSGGLFLTAVLLPLLAHRNELQNASSVQKDKEYCGFSPVQQSRLVDEENISFVEKLIEKLKNTDVNESAFSLGIVGEWGAGKTVFLNSIRERIKTVYNETPVVFNPWLGMTDQSIVHSFFNILSEKINQDFDIELGSPLREYASALVSIEGEGGFFSKIISIFDEGNSSNIFKLKETISKSLKQSHRKIFIVIDDLDRLSGEELFEVLRLIRVTADYPNLYYVTAYDRAYVESALASFGIEQSKRYLDKIFNVEVTLPKATVSQLSSLFRNELNTVDSSLNEATVERCTKCVIEYLHTFRDIKRFVREYSLTESLMANHITDDEYQKEDLFYLELLKYYDVDLYKTLRDHPEKVLVYKLNTNGAFWFELESEEGDGQLHLHDSRWLLRQLFGKDHPDLRSIRYLSNFQRYFTYSLHSDVIKRTDFKKWTEASDEEAGGLFETMKMQAANGFSLLFHLSSFPAEHLSLSKLQDISAYLISNFFVSGNHSGCSREVFYSILEKTYLNEGQVDISAYFGWLENHIGNLELSFSGKAKLLKLIRTRCDFATDEIRNLEKSNLLEYLHTSHPDPAEIAHNGSLLQEIYSNSIVWSHRYYYDPSEGDEVSIREGDTPLFATLLEYFKENPGDKDSRHDLYDTMFCFEDIDADGETYVDELIEDEAEGAAISVFGSLQKYQQYYENAFA